MPISSSSLLTTRNFISHALPFILDANTEIADADCFSTVVLCTSSSFMNGSLTPETFLMLQERASWAVIGHFSVILSIFSSSLQFVNKVNMESLLPLSDEYNFWAEYIVVGFLFKMTSETRYFIRQCETLHLVLSFKPKATTAIFETCLPQMTALRKLVVGPEDSSSTSEVIVPNSIPEAALVMALKAARNLDTLELNYQCTLNMTDETLENIWKVNNMPYLRSLRIGGCNLSPISDLTCIPKYHPKLTSLKIEWCYIDEEEGEANGFTESDYFLTPPDLTLMPELRNFGYIFEYDDEDGMFDHLIPEKKRREGHYLKYLSSLKIVFCSGDAERIFFFIKNFDGSLIRDLDVRFVCGGDNEREIFHDDDEIAYLTRQFPLLQKLSIDGKSATMTNKIFHSIADNSVGLQQLDLCIGINTGLITDKNMAFLFDPAKCVGGVFRTLEDIYCGGDGNNYDDDDQEDAESETIRGLNWFGSGLKDGAKHYCLKKLTLNNLVLDAEGFSQICTAFSHCLECLWMNAQLNGLLSETKTVMPVMKKLEYLSVKGPSLNMKQDCGLIIKNCIRLSEIGFTEYANSRNSDIFNADDIVSSIAENFIDGENNMLSINIHAFGLYRHDGSSSCTFSTKCQQQLSQLKSLRNIQSSKEVDWSVLKEARPDIKISLV